MEQEVVNGWFVLHDMRTFDWEKWRNCSSRERQSVIREFVQLLERWEKVQDRQEGSQMLYSVVGQKADLLLVILRPTMKELNLAETALAKTRFLDFTKSANSYLAAVEKSSFSGEPNKLHDDPEIQKKLRPAVPKMNHICFYPMSKRRGEQKNWFTLPIEDRKRMMFEHIETCKKYNQTVKRIITGSSGLDDYEWGISLFADDAMAFKNIIYDTRFDEVSAVYGLFGPFYIGNRMKTTDMESFFAL
ncbi:MAG TPA: hydrogen peroxide-dependent heme synthase [Bacillales bacterium]|nr:hydrogen peroxide-dependent heme synthase [Bacillales bacterium]